MPHGPSGGDLLDGGMAESTGPPAAPSQLGHPAELSSMLELGETVFTFAFSTACGGFVEAS